MVRRLVDARHSSRARRADTADEGTLVLTVSSSPSPFARLLRGAAPFVAAALAVLSFAVPAFAAPADAAAKRVVLPEDLFRLALVSDARISPDGTSVAFVVARMNGPANRYDTDLWTVDVATRRTRALTSSGRASSPRWSPDGARIAFVQTAGGVPQIFAYDVRARTTAQLSRVANGAFEPVWSHDGRRIAFASVTVDPPRRSRIDFAAAGFTPTAVQRTTDVRMITTMHFQVNGQGEVFDRHAHVWVMDATGAHTRALTSGHRWSEGSHVWSPDDRTIAFTSLRRDPPTIGESDIYTIPSAGGAMRKLRSPGQANTQPVYGHGGELWFFSGTVEDTSGFPALVTARPSGAGRRELVPENRYAWGDWLLADLKQPGAICGPWLTPGDRALIVGTSAEGTGRLMRFDARTGAATALTTRSGELSDCSVSADGARVAYVRSDALHPAEVYAVDARTHRERALTALNAPYLATVALSRPQPFTVTDKAGFTVHAWFMPAVGPKAHGPRPTIVDIHGGPQTEFGDTFFHEFQVLAGRGYNVVYADPRGSVGFGYAFEHALVANWGDAMFEDVMAVTDAAARRPGVDASRLGVSGGSYGGYASLWVVSHTDRFKAAIAERVASDLGTQQLDWDLASTNLLGGGVNPWGKPWDPSSLNPKQSPLTYVENVHTPLLLLHSTQDIETPVDQTLDEFAALKQLGRSVVYVEVPGENHDLNRTGSPIHRTERLHILIDWLDRWLRP